MVSQDHILASGFLILFQLVLPPWNLKGKLNLTQNSKFLFLLPSTSLLEYLQIFSQDCKFPNACFGLLALPHSL